MFNDVRPSVTTGPFTNATESSVTLTGHIDPLGRGNITLCHFEWGFDKSYGHIAPCTPDPSTSNFTEPTDVTTTLTGFSPGAKDHYRLVATNALGATSKGEDRTFITTQPPAIDGLASENLTATSADLDAQINPNGLETTYRFEYGTTTSYGQSAPVPGWDPRRLELRPVDRSSSRKPVPHAVYHYRLVATNADGTTTPKIIPSTSTRPAARTKTSASRPKPTTFPTAAPTSSSLRAMPAAPSSIPAAPTPATRPTRRASPSPACARRSRIRGSPIDGSGDLYVATRTDTGWVTKYVGLPSTEAAVDGGPPHGPPNRLRVPGESGGCTANESSAPSGSRCIQNNVLTDPG